MSIQDRKNWPVVRIVGVSMVILPTLFLLWVMVDTFSYLFVPWEYAGFNDYLLLKESAFWILFTQHCPFFEAKWITRVVWYFSWFFSMLGLLILTKSEQNLPERVHTTPISLETDKNTLNKGNFSRDRLLYVITKIQLILLTVGTIIQKIRMWFFIDSGDLDGQFLGFVVYVVIFLLIFAPFSILPQFFLMKIFSRRIFSKSKLKWDRVTLPLLMLCLLISFPLFGRLIACG
jgi:hypothetical protein